MAWARVMRGTNSMAKTTAPLPAISLTRALF
jgi:hypothetical protein